MPPAPAPIKQRFTDAVVLGILFAALFAFHAFTLDDEEYWFDELFSWNVAALPSFSAIWERLESDTSPPVYFWALHLWQPLARHFDLSYRWISAAGAILGLAGFYLWMRRGFGRTTGLLAAVLLAFSPFWIAYGQELRMYSIYPAMLWWGAYFLTRAVESHRRADWMAAAALNALALWTHYHAAFFILAESVALFLIWRQRNESERKALWKEAFLGMSLFLILISPLLALLSNQLLLSLPNIAWLRTPKATDFIFNFTADYIYYAKTANPVWAHAERMMALSFHVLLATGIGLALRRRKQTNPALNFPNPAIRVHFLTLLLCTALIPPIVMILLSFFPVKFYNQGRYAILSLAPYLGFLALLLHRAVADKGMRVFLVALLLTLNMISAWQMLSIRHKPDWSAIAAAVENETDEDTLIFGFPQFWFNGFQMYLGRDINVRDFHEFSLSNHYDGITTPVFALIFNLADSHDGSLHCQDPWQVPFFLESNSRPHILHRDTWHTMMKYDDLNIQKVREWYLRCHLMGRMDILTENPVWFLGAENLSEWLDQSKTSPAMITNTGELKCWLVDPPIRFTAPVTLEPGEYTLTFKVNLYPTYEDSPMWLALRINDKPIQSFAIEEAVVAQITAPISVKASLSHPVIELDGSTFRPVDRFAKTSDDRRLFLELYWMAIVKNDDRNQ